MLFLLFVFHPIQSSSRVSKQNRNLVALILKLHQRFSAGGSFRDFHIKCAVLMVKVSVLRAGPVQTVTFEVIPQNPKKKGPQTIMLFIGRELPF